METNAKILIADENSSQRQSLLAELRRAGYTNVEIATNGEDALFKIDKYHPDVVIIDPPRKGSTKELVDTLAELDVPRVVYVSCDPSTLARDCAWFRDCGYEIGDVTPVDMFPRTGHVESVVCLERRRK